MTCTIVAMIPPKNKNERLYENNDTVEKDPKAIAE